MSGGIRRDTCPANIFSVSAHAKFSIILHITITQRVINVKRYYLTTSHYYAFLALLWI